VRVLKVGLVDDHPAMLRGLRELLTREMACVVVWDVASVSAGRDAMTRAPVDVVIVDLTLQEYGDGVQLIQDLAARHPPPAVIALSGDPMWEQAALKAGAVRFLTKSATASTICKAVLDAGAGRRRPSAGSDLQRGLAALSAREIEVLNWIRAGRTNREIADQLSISPTTVNKHVQRVLKKLGAKNRTHAVTFLPEGAES
jgi:two-component system, NarL family, response regulator